MEMSEILIVLIGSSITMMGWSLIYKENVFYRVIEHLIIGLMTGYTAYTTLTILINNILMPLITDGAYLNIVPIIFGLFLLNDWSDLLLYTEINYRRYPRNTTNDRS